jgi:hypothetical protein
MRFNSVESDLDAKQMLGMRVIMLSTRIVMMCGFSFTPPKLQKKVGATKVLA